MKKLVISIFVLFIPVFMFGCQKLIALEDSMSEITKIYFTAETQDAKANISVGRREEDYIIDGKHTKNVDFSLISLKFNNLLPVNQIEVQLVINDVSTSVILDLNPANHYYMTDLGYKLNENDKILLNYGDLSLDFQNESKNFGIDYSEALKIAKSELGDKIEKYYNGKNFAGEGYLKVLTSQDDEGELFWVLTLVAKDGSRNNVVLSVVDGKILISD